MKENINNKSRRNFIKNATLGGVGLSLSGLLGTEQNVAGASLQASSFSASKIPKGQMKTGHFNPTWESLQANPVPIPEWIRDAKFGIYCHWGIYSVPAYDSEHYAHHIYGDPGYSKWGIRDRHIAIYGPLEKFGYHNFIPMFKAEYFNADQWAELFQKAGARFAGPVAEHEDGFAMWNSKVTPFNAKAMGPRRDIVGELEKAIRARGMKFFASMHNGVHYDNVKLKPQWDYAGAKYAKLYGSTMNYEDWFAMWEAKGIELVDKYHPDILYNDVGLDRIPDAYKQRYLAHAFNESAENNREVIVTYKKNDLPPGVGMLDHESSHPKEIIAQPWLCDYTIGTGLSPSWGYTEAMEIRSSADVLRMLIEVVANNGQLLLNLSPKADGTIPENQKQVVLKVGQWLWAYGEAIYNTRPFSVSGEDIGNGQHVFYTRNGRNLYAIFLQYPGKEKPLRLRTLTPERLKAQVASVKLLGIKTIDPCTFIASSGGLEFTLPKTSGQPSDLATVVRIELIDK